MLGQHLILIAHEHSTIMAAYELGVNDRVAAVAAGFERGLPPRP